MKTLLPTLLFFLISGSFLTAQEISEFIHVDQFGYTNNAEKVAVISNPQNGYNANLSYTPGSTLQLRDFNSNSVVFSGTPQVWNNGNVHAQSGDRGWWFDFSSVVANGTYYVFDASTGHRSAPFEINANPYDQVLKAATKMFYYNRSNFTKEAPYAAPNWRDGQNFLQDAQVRDAFDQGNASTAKDLRGGWFDAGDYNKYVTFAHDPVHQLLSSYEENTEIFTDNWNIPESGDGVPDILNEIKWELDWMRKMINENGSVHIKMGSLDYDINDAAPPSNNTQPRYYAPTCTSAAVAVASSFAHAAKVFQDIPGMNGFAQQLVSDAERTWNYFRPFFEENTLQTNCDDQTVKAGDADWEAIDQINVAVIAAIYLYEVTGNTVYSNFVNANYSRIEPYVVNFWATNNTVLLESMLLYASRNDVNSTVSNTILNNAAQSVNGVEWYDFRTDDLYRASSPDWAYYWGSNQTKSDIALLCLIMEKYDVVPSANSGLRRKAQEQLHYFHGINPQGIVYLSNMYEFGGDRCANEIFHTWFNYETPWSNALTSQYGPAPGFLPGGPNQGYTGNLSPPANQPIQKSYLDYNNGFSDVAYEITEPAIYYQAAYVRFLANYVNNQDTPPPPPPTEEGTYVVRARGTTGQERLSLTIGGEIVNSFYINTTWRDYTFESNLQGAIRVELINDTDTRNAEVDYISVDGTIIQAEAQETNTAVFQDGSCGGSYSQLMNCSGYIQFSGGTPPPPPPPGEEDTYVIRARGTTGQERLSLTIGGTTVGSFYIGTVWRNYTFESNLDGTVRVEYINDTNVRNAEVDYIGINGTIIQAEAQASNTAVFQNNSCGGSYSQLMNCPGYIEFSGDTPPPPPPPTEDAIYVIRARGATGQERLSLTIGGNTVGSVYIGTVWRNYSFESNLEGVVRVEYINDSGDRNVDLDYLSINGTIMQAEAQSINTSVYQNNSCGGSFSEYMDCPGYIEFSGNTPPPPPPPSDDVYVVRAKGATGQERLSLTIGGNAVGSFYIGTVWRDYTFESNLEGAVRVEYINDSGNRNADVDYLSINGNIMQAEDQEINTSVYQDNSCGGSYSEYMDCPGYIEFSANPNLKAAFEDSTNASDEVELLIYPNPTSGMIYLQMKEEYSQGGKVVIYDNIGRRIKEMDLRNSNRLDISPFPSGMYFLKVDLNNKTILRKIMRK